MLIPQRGSPAYQALYTDNDGEEVGLDDVQLLDEPSNERVAALTALLGDANPFVRYQAILVLTAWGIDAGIAGAEALLTQADGINMAPHRLTGEDNRFDELAEAVHLYLLSDGDADRAARYFHALLERYPRHFFESRFKRALLKHATVDMAAPIEAAIRVCLAAGRAYQASQLLPVLAKLAPQRCAHVLPLPTVLPRQIPDPAANVAEALRYMPGDESDRMLAHYLHHDGAEVVAEANESIAFRMNNATS